MPRLLGRFRDLDKRIKTIERRNKGSSAGRAPKDDMRAIGDRDVKRATLIAMIVTLAGCVTVQPPVVVFQVPAPPLAMAPALTPSQQRSPQQLRSRMTPVDYKNSVSFLSACAVEYSIARDHVMRTRQWDREKVNLYQGQFSWFVDALVTIEATKPEVDSAEARANAFFEVANVDEQERLFSKCMDLYDQVHG
jgi:hypothetical protein